jgi:4-aminobutyrate aminotransferase
MSFFAQSGTERGGGVEIGALHHGRGRFIGFLGGFHGRTMGSLSFTSSKYTQQKGFFPSMPGVTHVPYPNNYRPLFSGAIRAARCCATSKRFCSYTMCRPAKWRPFSSSPSRERAAIWCRPMGSWQGLRELCDRHGILLIFDEVQSGIGRTGKMFAAQHWDVAPDIMTLAKGLGSGMPIGMVVAKRSIMQKWTRGAHGNTFGGNPLCCAAALATLDLVEQTTWRMPPKWGSTSRGSCTRWRASMGLSARYAARGS